MLQVVLMNQVTTKVLDNNRGSKLVPALGEPTLGALQHASCAVGLTLTCNAAIRNKSRHHNRSLCE